MKIFYYSTMLVFILSVWTTCISGENYPKEEEGIKGDQENVDVKIDVIDDKQQDNEIEAEKVWTFSFMLVIFKCHWNILTTAEIDIFRTVDMGLDLLRIS